MGEEGKKVSRQERFYVYVNNVNGQNFRKQKGNKTLFKV